MAAAEYYNPSSFSSRPDYGSPRHLNNRPPAPLTMTSSTQPSALYSQNPSLAPSRPPRSPFDAYAQDHGFGRRQHAPAQPSAQDSHSSLGRQDEQDQYADNIPLKSNMKMSSAEGDLQKQALQYNSNSLENQEPPHLAEKSSRRGRFFSGKTTWVVYFLTLVQCSVFIGEIVKNSILTKSPIQIRPRFNFMIGPSISVLINMGARYVPCMRSLPELANTVEPVGWPCPNTTTTDPLDPSNQCTLSELCGFGGINEQHPNQWFRFITPMFLHAGLLHLGLNMLIQCTLGRDMEKQIGSLRFALVYVSSGIFGFVLGGNFAAVGIASTGASGALFGILALFLLDLFYTWKERRHPVRDLLMWLLDFAVAFVLGLLPGVVDNFSHLGGLLMGLVLGLCILHSPNALRQRIGESATPYEAVDAPTGVKAFTKKPVGFFKGRKPLWWAWWLVRVGGLVAVLITFVVLLNNFYKYHNTCSWCKYLSCLPIKGWCSVGNLNLTEFEKPGNSSKRDLFGGLDGMAYNLF